MSRDDDKEYWIHDVNCPDCGPGRTLFVVEWVGDEPESGRCDQCGEVVFLARAPRRSTVRAVDPPEPTVNPLHDSDGNPVPPTSLPPERDDDDYA